jgi:hypothetical protein
MALFSVLAIGVGIVSFISHISDAASLANWNPGNIIDDSVMTSKDSMNAGQIQAFLQSKVPACDTNGAQPSEMNNAGVPDYNGDGTIERSEWGQYHYGQTVFTCLKDYAENGLSASQIIYNIAQQYAINPRVLIVLLQKEQGLVTDTWPLAIQYRSATGYGCPDTAACDTTYYGFTNQVTWSAKMFRAVLNQSPTWYSPYVLGSNYIQWNPNSGCGGSTVNIQNLSTVALYDYTPYQPNQAALNAGYGMGDGCSSYGNRNFYLYFTDWFGSTYNNIPWNWSYVSQAVYTDSGYSSKITAYEPSVAPGGTIYAEVKALNSGNMTWDTHTHIGADSPMDRSSPFYDPTWLATTRPAGLQEASVAPGTVGTFRFALHAPNTTGTYFEYYNLVEDGTTWFNRLGLRFIINVTNPVAARNATNISLSVGQSINTNQYLLSPDTNSVLALQPDGNLVLYDGFKPTWSSMTSGSGATKLTMQGDGNLVLYTATGRAVWSTATNGTDASILKTQTDGNLVLYNGTGTARWTTATGHSPDHLSDVTRILPNNGMMFRGQRIENAQRTRFFIFQSDGNLVLYNASTGAPLWSSGTDGKGGALLAMQGDGNLVLYSAQGSPVWYTGTSGQGPTRLEMQADSNLVLYKAGDIPTWNTVTAGK